MISFDAVLTAVRARSLIENRTDDPHSIAEQKTFQALLDG